MTQDDGSWTIDECIVRPAEGLDSTRVYHRPTKTEVFIGNIELEHRVRQSIDSLPAATSLDDRRRRVAVRMAWESHS